ncbi:MAG: sulfide/dihydroorotate dehydrogenase-like FAD/NAD-binding protein [Clostridiaceae bacterium]
MDYEYVDCIDAGTQFCPCHLAETDECILCSQLNGKKFCDCKNWKGVCIYQELVQNENKAKKGRETFNGSILEKIVLDEKIILLTIKLPHYLVKDLTYVGSFVFVRNPNAESFYDAPISIMEADSENDIIKIAIEIRGIKTKNLLDLEDKILVRGPYWNGVLGLKNIVNTKDKVCVVIASKIATAPSIPVIKKLKNNGNKIIYIFENGGLNLSFINDYLIRYTDEIIQMNLFKNGELTDEFRGFLDKINKETFLIHCSTVDIIIAKVINYLEDKKHSCCNNAKMCCGEGVCGSCSIRYKNHRVKRLCKIQIEPKYIFEDRRLI